MTRTQFQTKAETLFRNANPDATDHLTIDWEFVGPTCEMKGAPGKMRHGHFLATSLGYGTIRVFASHDTISGWSVRPGGRIR